MAIRRVTNAAEFKQARRDLGLSVSELASILNTVRLPTIRKWERINLDYGPNPVACRVLEWMLNGNWPHEVDGRWEWDE